VTTMPTRIPERWAQEPSPAPVVQCLLTLAEARTLASRAQAARVHNRELRDEVRRQRLAARDRCDQLRLGVQDARRNRAAGPGPRSSAAGRPAPVGPAKHLLHLHVEYAQHRDPALRTELARAYDSFALSVARQFRSRRETPEDLAQVARIGLLYALDRFEPARKVPFAPFARATIVGELKRHVRDRTWSMRVPRSLQERYLAVVRALEELTHELGRSPRIPELAARAGLTDEQVLEAIELGDAQRPLSFDAPFGDGDGPALDPASEDSEFGAVEGRALLDVLMARLSERERRILHLRFVEELTQAEIARQLGLSQMSISRLLTRILASLRTRYRCAG
jgi:RNA polymerase sigma-B factor